MKRSATKCYKRSIKHMIGYSLIFGICIALAIGFACVNEQRDIASKVIRLHVIPNSDSSVDQKLKEAVRDDITGKVNVLLKGVSDINEAENILSDNIKDIEQGASDLILREGFTYSVNAELHDEAFSTREYDTFTLPAGNYRSLRVTIGNGKGENWWCVVFPPLCFAGSVDFQETAEAAGFTEGEIKLISKQGEEDVIFKFQILELIKRLTEFLTKP